MSGMLMSVMTKSYVLRGKSRSASNPLAASTIPRSSRSSGAPRAHRGRRSASRVSLRRSGCGAWAHDSRLPRGAATLASPAPLTAERSVSTPAGWQSAWGTLPPTSRCPQQDGLPFTLQSLLGTAAVVLDFYPKDDTPGCTAEACSFRHAYEDFKEAGAEAVGVSSDSAGDHQAFADKHRLPFTLVSDVGGKVRKLYGVPGNLLGLVPGRVTYVIPRPGRRPPRLQLAAQPHQARPRSPRSPQALNGNRKRQRPAERQRAELTGRALLAAARPVAAASGSVSGSRFCWWSGPRQGWSRRQEDRGRFQQRRTTRHRGPRRTP